MRAVKACKAANIYFYQVLRSLSGLNGNNVRRVHDEGREPDPTCLQTLYYPTVKTTDAWADDSHFVELVPEAEREMEKQTHETG